MVTLSDIAARTGYSVETVSRVLNRKSIARRNDSRKRALRIQRVAVELGYRPNRAAQAMCTGRFNTVALLMSCGHSPHIDSQALFGVEEALVECGMHLLFERLSEDILANQTALPSILQQAATDGILVHEITCFSDDIISALDATDLPVVWLRSRREANCVYFDEEAAAADATRCLLRAGHRRIAYAGPEPNPHEHHSVSDRWAGFRRVLREAGLSPSPLPAIRPSPEPNAQGEATSGSPADVVAAYVSHHSPEERATAVLAYCASLGANVYVGALRAGLQVPAELSLIQFGGNYSHLGIELTHMARPEWEMGRLAVGMLVERIEGNARPLSPRVMRPKLVQGCSVAPPPKRGGDATLGPK